jgi:arsenate reductase
MKNRVLFVCIHNSARSQMAEALLNKTCGGSFTAESAGLEPGTLNPLAVEVLREIGIDISGKRTRNVDEVLKSGTRFDYIITVCDESSAAHCPSFPRGGKRLHWSFPDPASLTGTHEERLARTRELRDAIQRKMDSWCAAITHAPSV